MPIPSHLRGSDAAGELGRLALSVVAHDEPMLGLRAVQWRSSLAKVGLAVPFWVVHDLGLLAVQEPPAIAPRPIAANLGLAPQDVQALNLYAETLREIAESEVLERAREWRLADELLSVLLLKVLGPIWERYAGPAGGGRGDPTALPLDPELFRELNPELPGLWRSRDRSIDLGFLRRLAHDRLRLITAVEQVDLDTLRLLGMFGLEASAAGALQLLDVLNVLESPEANDVVNFSLDLLPSVLEAKRSTGAQSFSVDGYSGVQRHGTLDSLVLSELAFDADVFDRRYAEKELFFYAREKQHEEDRRLHYICVDASASMRGKRSVFARGLALTLIKKLVLQGEDVYFRFFDSRLYELQHARGGRTDSGGVNVPYVLSFKGERGRNYAKVFGLLANELERLQRREKRHPVLYFLTHAECHVPEETIDRLGRIGRLYGIFMLPSTGELELDYLPRLDTVQIVDERALGRKEERAARALEIVDDASRQEVEARDSLVPAPRESIPPGMFEE